MPKPEVKFQVNVEGSRRGVFNAIRSHAGDLGRDGWKKESTEQGQTGRWFDEWQQSWPMDEDTDPDTCSGTFTVRTIAELQALLHALIPHGKPREETYIKEITLWGSVRANAAKAEAGLALDHAVGTAEIDISAGQQQQILEAATQAAAILNRALTGETHVDEE